MATTRTAGTEWLRVRGMTTRLYGEWARPGETWVVIYDSRAQVFDAEYCEA